MFEETTITIEDRLERLEKPEKRNRRLPATPGRWLRRPRLPQPARIRSECVYILNINVLSRFKPYAGVGTYVLSGLTYTGGVEYRIDFAMENAPSLTISKLFSLGGHRGTSNRHEWAFGSGGWVDFVRSDQYDVMIGAAEGIGNINSPEEASKSEVRSFLHPAFSIGLRFP